MAMHTSSSAPVTLLILETVACTSSSLEVAPLSTHSLARSSCRFSTARSVARVVQCIVAQPSSRFPPRTLPYGGASTASRTALGSRTGGLEVAAAGPIVFSLQALRLG
ncbi:unnamed protein product [Pseudo-nitzschia multistriata]|uniref:Secreted protein n=1 Tax=Pseudo-nitzschia multistriata TaxID=183589 RepID=A0A448Z441_9STRA|nr:unnamed protein product [Pseudo-nitzschia multistriata]